MSRLAIMQPYFFPYLGYWQLMHAVDRFVIYDDVSYIKGGWINRNRLLIHGQPVLCSVPLHKASCHQRICDTALLPEPSWRDRLVRMVALTYGRAACFEQVFPMIEQLIRHDAPTLSAYLAHQLQALAAFMGIRTAFVPSSRRYANAHLTGQERVLDICRQEGAGTYINAQGGQALYGEEAFRSAGIELKFIAMAPIPYPQKAARFVPGLSIIDVLMAVGPLGIRRHLDAFQLLPARAGGLAAQAGAMP